MTKAILNQPLVKLLFVISLAAGLILGVVLPLFPVVHAAGITVFYDDVKRSSLAPASMASAAIITVTTTNDEYDDDTDDQCSLREAIKAVSKEGEYGGCPAGSDGAVISLPAGVYTLTRTYITTENSNYAGDLDLDIDGALTISGAGAGTTIIMMATDIVTPDRVLEIRKGNITIKGVTIINGQSITGSHGGGIYNRDTLTVTNSAVNNNTTGAGSGNGSGGNGGGIYNESVMTIINSTVNSNTTGAGTGDNDTGGNGGGIYNNGTMTIINSTVSSNTAGAGGNEANGGWGGGIYNSNILIITNSTISSNTSGHGGGDDGNGGKGGGIFSEGALTLANSTVSANSTGDESFEGSAGNGAGIFIKAGTLNSTNNTIVYNQTGVFGAKGGGIVLLAAANMTIKNTILANNQGPEGNDCRASDHENITSQNFNLVEDVSAGGCITAFNKTHDITGADPRLEPLADNGGETKTHALQLDSPAIDAADCSGSSGLSTDQRGKFRPVDVPLPYDNAGGDGDGCDIGAYEAQPELSLRKTASPLNLKAGERVTYTIVISNNGVFSATGVVVSDPLTTSLTLSGTVTINRKQGSTQSPPVTIKDITITPDEPITITIPVVISTAVLSNTIITNTATLTSVEITTPITSRAVITINAIMPEERGVYLPLLLKNN